jgi:hypothetical protein
VRGGRVGVEGGPCVGGWCGSGEWGGLQEGVEEWRMGSGG